MDESEVALPIGMPHVEVMEPLFDGEKDCKSRRLSRLSGVGLQLVVTVAGRNDGRGATIVGVDAENDGDEMVVAKLDAEGVGDVGVLLQSGISELFCLSAESIKSKNDSMTLSIASGSASVSAIGGFLDARSMMSGLRTLHNLRRKVAVEDSWLVVVM